MAKQAGSKTKSSKTGKKSVRTKELVEPEDSDNSEENVGSQSAESIESQDKQPDAFKAAWNDFFIALEKKSEFEDDVKKAVRDLIAAWFEKNVNEALRGYDHLFLIDEDRMIYNDADRIYKAARRFDKNRPVLLTLQSTGGSIAAAYLISKLCREFSSGKFSIAVPRRAKSAATLLCCGADELHMGSLSELGPIDPQINDMPALGLKQAVEHIAQMTKAHPSSAEMFAKYLHLTLDLNDLGYYERVAESAVQYAERLFNSRSTVPEGFSATMTANALVYDYKDHGFLIDASEASSVFGSNIVRTDTDEYNFANSFYEFFDLLQMIIGHKKYHLNFIGAPGDQPGLLRNRHR